MFKKQREVLRESMNDTPTHRVGLFKKFKLAMQALKNYTDDNETEIEKIIQKAFNTKNPREFDFYDGVSDMLNTIDSFSTEDQFNDVFMRKFYKSYKNLSEPEQKKKLADISKIIFDLQTMSKFKNVK